jgi:Uma2 family endonuclease
MSNAIRLLPHYTYEDWMNWEGQWELIEGIPYAMSPMPVPNHQRIGGNLFTEFRLQLKNCKKCAAYQPIDYKVADDIIVQPDLLIVCGEILKKYLDFPPVLVVEILSPSTALKDRHSKFEIYQDQKIKYYLIVSPDTQEVEVYEYVSDGYELKQKDKDLRYAFNFASNCTGEIDFKEIW